MPPPELSIDPASLKAVTDYEVGAHRVTVGRRGTWWFVAVDGVLLRGRFPTAATAWTAGVHRADELDRARGPRRERSSTRSDR